MKLISRMMIAAALVVGISLTVQANTVTPKLVSDTGKMSKKKMDSKMSKGKMDKKMDDKMSKDKMDKKMDSKMSKSKM